MEVVQVSSSALPRLLVFTALAAVLVGCGSSDKKLPRFRLQGSLTQLMDLGYDEARILVSPNDVSLTFVRIKTLETLEMDAGQMAGTSEDYPIKLAYQLDGDEPPSGGRVDLAALDSNGSQRGVVSRNVQGDPRSTFPPILRGTIAFNRPLETGTTVTGDFHITFENGTEVASGRTVFSNYTAQVQ